MAKLGKRDLLSQFEEAVRRSSWTLLFLSRQIQPARYQISRDDTHYRVNVFIWNITHGGKGRRDDEYRIQVTGIEEFKPLSGEKNLILGWWDDLGVFAGWDFRQHRGTVSSSPSMQVSEGALRQALITGFAPYINQNGETAIAFRPDFAGTYIQFLEELHDSGSVPAEAAILSGIAKNPDDVDDDAIDRSVARPRKSAIITTKRTLRALDFAQRVLSAYGHSCAMCGTQLRLIDGAHILPVADNRSTDDTSNGVALCTLHHRAYDTGLVTFDADLRTRTNDKMIARLKSDHRVGGLTLFKNSLRPVLVIPPDKRDRPAAKFVNAANALRGWV